MGREFMAFWDEVDTHFVQFRYGIVESVDILRVFVGNGEFGGVVNIIVVVVNGEEVDLVVGEMFDYILA